MLVGVPTITLDFRGRISEERFCAYWEQIMSRPETTEPKSRLDWEARRERIVLSDADFEHVQKLLESPPGPTPALKAAVARRTKRKKE